MHPNMMEECEWKDFMCMLPESDVFIVNTMLNDEGKKWKQRKRKTCDYSTKFMYVKVC